MVVLAVVTARSGSKGVRLKNLRKIGSRSLTRLAVDSALESRLVTSICLTTDSHAIAKQAEDYSFFMRSEELACDTARSIDVVKDALIRSEKHYERIFDYCVLLEPTSPFRRGADIDKCLTLLKNNESATSVVSVVNVGDIHPMKMKRINGGNIISDVFGKEIEGLRRQDLEPLYIRNGAIYCFRRKNLFITPPSLYGKESLAYIMTSEESRVNIDTELDLMVAQLFHASDMLPRPHN